MPALKRLIIFCSLAAALVVIYLVTGNGPKAVKVVGIAALVLGLIEIVAALARRNDRN